MGAAITTSHDIMVPGCSHTNIGQCNDIHIILFICLPLNNFLKPDNNILVNIIFFRNHF